MAKRNTKCRYFAAHNVRSNERCTAISGEVKVGKVKSRKPAIGIGLPNAYRKGNMVPARRG